jgi:hypothetical protein
MLIPRVTVAQRTTADDALAGGLLTAAGALRGGAAQGLLVYQTDGVQGFYYNVSLTTLPDWKFLGAGSLATQNADAVAITGGTVSSATVTNPTLSGGTIANTAISGGTVSNSTVTGGTIDSAPIGATTPAAVSATTLKSTGTAEVQGAQITLGKAATAAAGKLVLHDNDAATATATTIQSASTVSSDFTLTLPANAGAANQVLKTDGTGNLSWTTPIVATGDLKADGTVAMTGDMNMGTKAITNVASIAFVGNDSAVGNSASATTYGSTVGYQSNASNYGAAVGYQSNGYDNCVAMGYRANGYAGAGAYSGSVSIGHTANAFSGDGSYCGGVAIGYNANARHNVNEDDSGAVSVGFAANSYPSGTALGHKANGYNQGVAVGGKSFGVNTCVAVGYIANGYSNGTAIGYRANSGNMGYSVAKGGYSRCTRYNEEWKGADILISDPANGNLVGYNKFGYGQVNFNGTTSSNTPTEIFLGGSALKRFTLQDNSTVTFQIIVSAMNTLTGDSSGWIMQGTIKRRTGAATTALVASILTPFANEQGGLTTNPELTADNVNGSLKLSVTGVAANTVKWNAAMTYSEVRE